MKICTHRPSTPQKSLKNRSRKEISLNVKSLSKSHSRSTWLRKEAKYKLWKLRTKLESTKRVAAAKKWCTLASWELLRNLTNTTKIAKKKRFKIWRHGLSKMWRIRISLYYSHQRVLKSLLQSKLLWCLRSLIIFSKLRQLNLTQHRSLKRQYRSNPQNSCLAPRFQASYPQQLQLSCLINQSLSYHLHSLLCLIHNNLSSSSTISLNNINKITTLSSSISSSHNSISTLNKITITNKITIKITTTTLAMGTTQTTSVVIEHTQVNKTSSSSSSIDQTTKVAIKAINHNTTTKVIMQIIDSI